MPRNFDDISREVDERLAANPRGEEIRAQAHADLQAELAAHAFTLQELRRARALTQTQLARALDVSQAQVSRIEKQADLLLSTLASYVTAMGGELELVASFPEHPPVHLTVGELTGTTGDEPPGEPPGEEPVIDLMAALREALERARAAGAERTEPVTSK